MNDYSAFLAMISMEFHRYLIEREDIASTIPLNALMVFQVDGETEFNEWHKNMSLNNREGEQPILFVNVTRWRRHSSIEEVKFTAVAA